MSAEFKGLRTFATLSPVPGFMKWLSKTLAEGDPKLLTDSERRALSASVGKKSGAKGTLKSLLGDPGWHRNQIASEALRLASHKLPFRTTVVRRVA